MGILRLAPALLVLGIVPVPAAHAQQPDLSTPEKAAMAYMGAMRAGDAMGMARLMHPEALALLRSTLGTVLLTKDAAPFRDQLFPGRDVAALSDTEFFAGFLRFAMTQDPDLAQIMRTARMSVVGSVPEAETVHVLMRLTMTIEGITASKLEVFSAKRDGSRWLGLLSGDFEIMTAALQRAFGA